MAASPSHHEPLEGPDGTVTIGVVRHGGGDHELLDASATWQRLRVMVVNWYVQLRPIGGYEIRTVTRQ